MDKGKIAYDKAVDALCHCRLDLAKNLFKAAGEEYTSQAKSNRRFSDFHKLNSAICYYFAGYYEATVNIIAEIQTTRFDGDIQLMCNDLHEEARKRCKKSYWDGLVNDLQEMRLKGFHKDILNLLKNDPYCLLSLELATQMRDSCVAQGMNEVAALFERDRQALYINSSAIMNDPFFTSW